MNFLYAIFFGVSVAGIVYAKFGRRIGYGNQKAVFTVVGLIGFMAFIFFYTTAVYVLHLH